ncbi:MAG: hypothetical protein HFG09_08635 [Oscillibacter sp.]|nr:hypothetical protein [Oscillibacter sp.]
MICMFYLFVFFRSQKERGNFFVPADCPIPKIQLIFLCEMVKNYAWRTGFSQPGRRGFVFSFDRTDKVQRSINLYFSQITIAAWYNETNSRRKEARTWRQNTSFWQSGSGRS